MNIDDRMAFAVSIAGKLAQYQLSFQLDSMNLERKSDDSPVTVADKESERMFRQAVKEAFPEDDILGEEEGGGEGGKPRWVIDPIDGTRKFMRNLPFWGICIAFEVESEVELGVVAVPGSGKMWTAQKGKGAWCAGQRITVDQSELSLDRAILTMPPRKCFTAEKSEAYFDNLQERIEHDPGFLDAYSYSMIADGRVHGLLSCADRWWDIAAPVCIVKEAGGCFTDLKNGPPAEGKLNLAACPSIHEKLLDWAKYLA
ncbi:MAG: inositol monophosphatase [Planctomycetes bacterium]|nr:inositol monophosphatase [Planctomycetota bacterium]